MDKSAEAFRTISEVSEVLDTPAHVLRFWESKFTQIKPVKRAGGRRYYRPTDVALLGGIRQLLHDDGLTIRGVQKILREKGPRHVAALVTGNEAAADHDLADVAAPVRAPIVLTGAVVAPPVSAPPVDPPPSHVSRGTGGDLFDRAVRGEASDAPEAPMVVDAPTLPFRHAKEATPFAAAAPDQPPMHDAVPQMPRDEDAAQADAPPPTMARTASDPDRTPAANLLRAMDALRARDNRPELMSVYQRLSTLRDRLARSEDPRQS